MTKIELRQCPFCGQHVQLNYCGSSDWEVSHSESDDLDCVSMTIQCVKAPSNEQDEDAEYNMAALRWNERKELAKPDELSTQKQCNSSKEANCLIVQVLRKDADEIEAHGLIAKAYLYRDAADTLAALQATREQAVRECAENGWQPIETAPKDGTHFIGWDGKRPFRCSAGRRYVLYPHQEGGPTYQDIWDGHYYDSLMQENPTHWQPLPTPPLIDRSAK